MTPFSFDFDQHALSEEQMRELIYCEALAFNPEYQQDPDGGLSLPISNSLEGTLHPLSSFLVSESSYLLLLLLVRFQRVIQFRSGSIGLLLWSCVSKVSVFMGGMCPNWSSCWESWRC